VNARSALSYAIEALLFAFEHPRPQGTDDRRASGEQARIVHQILADHEVTNCTAVTPAAATA